MKLNLCLAARKPLPLSVVVMMTACIELAIGISTFSWGFSASGVIGQPGYLAITLAQHGIHRQWGWLLCGSGFVLTLTAGYDILFEKPYDLMYRRHVLRVRSAAVGWMCFVWAYVVAVLAITASLWNVAALTCWAPFAFLLCGFSFVMNKKAEAVLDPDPEHDTPGLHYL